MTLGHIKTGRGFTLIELLVVIAIIGILSSVVLASLNTARNRGADSAVKSNLANARAEAELYYDGNGTSGYTNVCGTTAGMIGDNVNAALDAQGRTVTTRDTLAESCYSSATAWAASVPLKTDVTKGYCVDSTGAATTTAVGVTITDFNC
jgi:prepilin-type N-terminal cleavage/methylation domain-containing protein